MVGFVERFRKPKLPIVLGSPQRDDVVHQQVVYRPQNITLPVLRNFSYPTNITNNKPPHSTPAVWEEPPSTWDQLGEICNFSPSITSRTREDRTAGLEDPFFYTTDRSPYKKLAELGEKLNTNSDAKKSIDSKNVEKGGPKDKDTKTPKNQLIGDHIFSQKCSITARLKRSSLGHHKTSSSFDASRLLTRRSGSLERPMSSSGVPLIDTRLTHSTSTTTEPSVSPLFFAEDTIEGFLADSEKATLISYTLSDSYAVDMGSLDSKGSSQGPHNVAHDSEGLSRQCSSRASEPHKRKGKGGRSRWFSHLKEWVSVSEPSTQALENYKKDTYNKAGIALDDPLANAKLHLPVASLPPDAIKPGGRGPEPEEIFIQRAMQRKKARELLLLTGASQGSRSSGSDCSSPSNVTVTSAPKDGE
ncbi:hypothetical protein F4824DRAFT_511574 [Ustulina deusta]|nr:hypothetical protein F4824DRAFT_511574 [Ustulina deusta]